MSIAMSDDDGAADQCVGDAALLAEERRRLREEVQVEGAETLDEDGAEHEREDEDGEERRSAARAPRRASGPAPAAEAVRVRAVMSYGSVSSCRAHPVDILRAFWNLFTIICADTFVISEITSRIAPR